MKRLLLAGFSLALVGLIVTSLVTTISAAPNSTHVKGQIIVKFRDDRSGNNVLRQHGASNAGLIGSTGARLARVPAGKELQIIDALSKNPNVEYAETDEVITATSADEYFSSQYALNNEGQSFTNTNKDMFVASGMADADIDAVEAWEVTKGFIEGHPTGEGIKVAILDTGVTNDNSDISGKVVASKNFTGGETGQDNYGHGTHVAGIVAAHANNTIGVAGVCPGCSILDGKVLDDMGIGSTSSIANGISWASANGAKVINMSLVQRTSSLTLESAVNNAWKKGSVIVAAAGNGDTQTKFYPAAYENVIAVAATDNNDARAFFSNYGATWVDVAAPGANVYSTFPNHAFYLSTQSGRSQGYDIANGTSMASPVVAGVAALAWDADLRATKVSVRKKVELTADRIEGTGTLWAHGRVNAYNAVK